MKQLNETKVLALATLIGLSISGHQVAAQDDFGGGDDVFNSDQIDIDGVYQRKETAADRIEKMRKNLERRNEDMVQKKIEDIRINQEKKLADQLKGAFNGNNALGGNDQVQSVQAAPQRVVAPAPVVEKKKEKTTRITPSFGVNQYNGDGIDGLESGPVMGLNIESMISPRFSVGVGVNYAKMDIVYFRDYNINPTYFTYLQGDEVNFKNLNLNINAKAFLSVDSMVKPFIGFGVGYSRTSLTLEERSKDNVLGYNTNRRLRETSVTGTSATGTVMGGAEFSFTESIGMTVDFRFTKALSNGFSNNSGSNSSTFNQGFSNQETLEKASLKRLGSDLDESNIVSLNAGLVVKF